jgi:hypothetical protein
MAEILLEWKGQERDAAFTSSHIIMLRGAASVLCFGIGSDPECSGPSTSVVSQSSTDKKMQKMAVTDVWVETSEGIV